jgi:hypothetical protein
MTNGEENRTIGTENGDSRQSRGAVKSQSDAVLLLAARITD